MKKEGFYSSGEFARMAHVTLRTIRYYDKHDILKPSFVTEAGARFYTDEDFARLQQILLLKYLGFSLEDIKEMTIGDSDYHFLKDSLDLQRKLVQDRIEQLQLVEQAIKDTSQAIEENHTLDWSRMLNLIHLTGMEKSLKNQYQNASNISARIQLHNLYSVNQQGWFPWILEQLNIDRLEADREFHILELGCGDGTLWKEALKDFPENVTLVLSDVSRGMLRDARRNLSKKKTKCRISYENFDCHKIPHKEESFDLVIANHVLFYCENIDQVCREVGRVLKPGGRFVCSTYGNGHMKEVSDLMTEFDPRIVLAADRLYERFGKENGGRILEDFFEDVHWVEYEDSLLVKEPEPLMSYVLSCHGNQGQYISDHYKDFRAFVKRKVEGGFYITKEAGVFIGRKNVTKS